MSKRQAVNFNSLNFKFQLTESYEFRRKTLLTVSFVSNFTKYLCLVILYNFVTSGAFGLYSDILSTNKHRDFN